MRRSLTQSARRRWLEPVTSIRSGGAVFRYSRNSFQTCRKYASRVSSPTNRPLSLPKHQMILHFCPQCGCKLQAAFKFCPSCGEKLPCEVDETMAAPDLTADGGPQQQISAQPSALGDGAPSSSLARSPLRKTRQSTSRARWREEPCSSAPPMLVTASTDSLSPAFVGRSPRPLLSPRRRTASPKASEEKDHDKCVVPPVGSPTPTRADRSPRAVSSPLKRKQSSPVVKQEEELCNMASPSSCTRSPPVARGRTKRAKRLYSLEPLQVGEQLSDTSGRSWRLEELLDQSDAELVYAARLVTTRISTGPRHILKLGAKDGKIFNEQIFLQRALKSASVEKWKKLHKQDFLGLPACEGFGLHADAYRFLILPNMGRTLQSVLTATGRLLSQKAVLQLACRMLDALEYMHENEYVHADVNAENVYVTPADGVQVYLAGYCHAFRYCPSGKHVEYREGSRTPHEGAVEFISVDAHKGAGPSRRSDLQALGYCLLRWLAGPLPWTALVDSPAKVAAEKERFLSDVGGLLDHCFTKRNMPDAVQTYLSRVMSLQYTECPDYQQLQRGLLEGLQKLGASLNQPLDLQCF